MKALDISVHLTGALAIAILLWGEKAVQPQHG